MRESRRIKALVSRKRTVKAFAELSYAHWVILDNAKQKRPGWLWECLTANILAGFKMEAFLDHFGNILFPGTWPDRGRKRDKLSKILKRLGINQGAVRYRTLREVFDIRDEVAHGKTVALSHKDKLEFGDIEDIRRRWPQTLWERKAELGFAQQAYDDTEAIMKEIATAAGLPDALRRDAASYTIQTLADLPSRA